MLKSRCRCISPGISPGISPNIEPSGILRFFSARMLPALLLLSCVPLTCVSPLQARSGRQFAAQDLQGHKTHLGDLEGHIVVVNFWATWCAPCLEELPRLSGLAGQYAGKASFILISIDELKNLDKVKEFIGRQKLTLPVWVGASIESIEQLSGSDALPSTLVLDEHGEIVRVVNGEAMEKNLKDVKDSLDWLLSGRHGPLPSAVINRN